MEQRFIFIRKVRIEDAVLDVRLVYGHDVVEPPFGGIVVRDCQKGTPRNRRVVEGEAGVSGRGTERNVHSCIHYIAAVLARDAMNF